MSSFDLENEGNKFSESHKQHAELMPQNYGNISGAITLKTVATNSVQWDWSELVYVNAVINI